MKLFRQFVAGDERILDYGCEYGRVTLSLKSDGYDKVIGYDTSAVMIEPGHREYGSLDLSFYKLPALPEANESFDAALCFAVMCCLRQ